MKGEPSLTEIGRVLDNARDAAVEYYELTDKPLGITGEIGEYEAARLLGLDLAKARAPGYDAVDSKGRLYQIKTRAIRASGKRRSQMLGSINLKHEWDTVLMVLLNDLLQPTEIHEADRESVRRALSAPGSKARNERGALAVSKFKSIGRRVWPVA